MMLWFDADSPKSASGGGELDHGIWEKAGRLTDKTDATETTRASFPYGERELYDVDTRMFIVGDEDRTQTVGSVDFEPWLFASSSELADPIGKMFACEKVIAGEFDTAENGCNADISRSVPIYRNEAFASDVTISVPCTPTVALFYLIGTFSEAVAEIKHVNDDGSERVVSATDAQATPPYGEKIITSVVDFTVVTLSARFFRSEHSNYDEPAGTVIVLRRLFKSDLVAFRRVAETVKRTMEARSQGFSEVRPTWAVGEHLECGVFLDDSDFEFEDAFDSEANEERIDLLWGDMRSPSAEVRETACCLLARTAEQSDKDHLAIAKKFAQNEEFLADRLFGSTPSTMPLSEM